MGAKAQRRSSRRKWLRRKDDSQVKRIRLMTIVKAVKVSFNSFKSPGESAKAMFGDFLVIPSQPSRCRRLKPSKV